MHVTEVNYRTTRSRGILEKRIVTQGNKRFLALKTHVFDLIKYKFNLDYI